MSRNGVPTLRWPSFLWILLLHVDGRSAVAKGRHSHWPHLAILYDKVRDRVKNRKKGGTKETFILALAIVQFCSPWAKPIPDHSPMTGGRDVGLRGCELSWSRTSRCTDYVYLQPGRSLCCRLVFADSMQRWQVWLIIPYTTGVQSCRLSWTEHHIQAICSVVTQLIHAHVR